MSSSTLLVSIIAALAAVALTDPGDNNGTETNSIAEPNASHRPLPLSQQFLGKWQLISSENFDKYMEVVGVNPLARTFGNAAKPILDITLENGKYKVVTEIHGFRTVTYEFVLNKEFDELTPDGRFMKSTFRLRKDGKLMQFQRKISPHDKDSKFTRSIEGNKLIVICEAEGVKATRIYERVIESPTTPTTPIPLGFRLLTVATLLPPAGIPIFSVSPLPPAAFPLLSVTPVPAALPAVPAGPSVPSEQIPPFSTN